MSEPDARLKDQIERAQRLQDKLLETYEKRLDAGTLSDTGIAALQKLLQSNGWSLDETKLPKGVRDLVPNLPKPDEFDDTDEDLRGVLPFPAKTGS